MLSGIWVVFVTASMLFGAVQGKGEAVAAAAFSGAGAAVELCLGLAAAICLWSGVTSLMEASGLSEELGRLLSPLLGRLFPAAWRRKSLRRNITANVTANLLGLGNAATPPGVAAAEEMAAMTTHGSTELRRFVVLNTASIQLLPATVAAIRSSCGAAAPFDILPAVWLSSAAALCAGLLACRLMERL